MNYALIEENRVVNLIWLNPGNARDFPGAVMLNDVPAGIGDSYDGKSFYRNGERVLTRTEELAARLADAEAALALLGVNTEVTTNDE